MATKWKNSVKQLLSHILRIFKKTAGFLFTFFGMCLLYNIVVYRNYLFTGVAVFLSILANLLLGIGIFHLVLGFWDKKYGDWLPKDEEFYQEWKKEGVNLEKKLLMAGASAMAIALLYCYYLSNNSWAGTGGWYINLASGYMMVITVFIQFTLCQILLIYLMNKKLNLLMEEMTEMNRRSLEKALEIERRSLEKVSRSDQLRVDLITNVSHDLKTPLTSMVGYLELLKKEELTDVARDYVEVIFERAEKLKEMIASLFSLAKASSGNVELHMEKFEINRLIEQILADMKDRIDESGLQFVTMLTDKSTELLSDNMYFYRICQNLLENTLKYSAKGTRVFIKSYVKGEKLWLEITNTAGYFMDFKKEDITERFVRGDKERSTEGNGLGLAIVSTYAKALGGEFDIQVDCDQFKAFLAFPKEKT